MGSTTPMSFFARSRRMYSRARKRHRQAFTLIELMIAVAIIGAIAALSVTRYEAFVCKTQESEAKATLAQFYDVESSLFAERGAYDPMQSCTFGYGPPVCTGNIIMIVFTGRSRFTYSVDVPAPGVFTAQALGSTGAVAGGLLTINQDGKLDASGTVCR